MTKRISVIIPTYNSWSTLKPCISSILRQTLKPYECVVIDNSSSDGTSEKLKKFFPQVKVITHRSNLGVTGGRNAGIAAADPSSDYLMFFDHDMVAGRKMLEELCNVGESSSEIGIVTPKIYYLGDKKRIWAAGTGMNLWTGQVLFRGGKDMGQYEKMEEVQVAPAAMLVKKEVIKKIKCFDKRYFATYEDTDFSFRAKKAGFRIFYSPKSVAYHNLSIDPKDEADRLLKRSYFVAKNRIIFMKDFGRCFPIFLMFIPVYAIYYSHLAISYGRFNDLISYFKGIIVGMCTGRENTS
jgi:GT2 family glycosyltransferase